MPKQNQSARASATRPPSLAALERLYAKTGALLHAANQQDHHIRQAAIATHDKVNAAIKAIEATLSGQLPEPNKALAEQYGKLLMQRKHLQDVIAKDRQPKTDQGHPTPL